MLKIVEGNRKLPGRPAAYLLAVILEHLIAGYRQFGTVLLEAGQNGEIALIDNRTAEALDIARTSGLLLRSAAALRLGLGGRAGGNRQRQQGGCQAKISHRVPLF
ncbi:MAG: hypothetical protein JF566_06955 [Bradyrhizobium sp.]|nr:hypothetical protein [Bradyrhizobium sp.]